MHHRFLRLGGKVRAAPHGTQSPLQQGQEDNDCDSFDHVPQRRKLLRHAPLLAYPGVQCLRLVNTLSSTPDSSNVNIGEDPIQVGVRALPIGFGIILGAVICLILIPITNGRVKALMIFFTALMTAGTGAMSVSTPDNLNTMYAILTVAAIGVGGVLIPSSIIAQIACPDELIATITAITLSIRYIGGAIGFAVYANLFFRKFTEYATQTVAIDGIIMNGIVAPTNITLVTHLVELVGNARYEEMKDIIAHDPNVLRKDAFELIISAAQKAFALAYRWPYWVSIAFGSACFILSFLMGDIGSLLTEEIAHPVEADIERK